MTNLDADVLELVCAVARDELLSRFRRLTPEQVHVKGTQDLVTDADLEAERLLSEGLMELLPGSVVVGEESSHSDPALRDHVAHHECAWVVDPLDGTAHYAAGRESFGIMVALTCRGNVEAAWIHLPISGRTAWARRGQGVRLDGQLVRIPGPPPLERQCGVLKTRFLPPELRRRVAALSMLERMEGSNLCAAQCYLDILAGTTHFALFYKTEPWDHAPGALLIQEGGGAVLRLDGSEYSAGDGKSGLLVAASLPSWQKLQARLLCA